MENFLELLENILEVERAMVEIGQNLKDSFLTLWEAELERPNWEEASGQSTFEYIASNPHISELLGSFIRNFKSLTESLRLYQDIASSDALGIHYNFIDKGAGSAVGFLEQAAGAEAALGEAAEVVSSHLLMDPPIVYVDPEQHTFISNVVSCLNDTHHLCDITSELIKLFSPAMDGEVANLDEKKVVDLRRFTMYDHLQVGVYKSHLSLSVQGLLEDVRES